MTILVRARTACAALIAGTAILATAASHGQDNPEKLAEQFGTAADAKAMLTKTLSALKADKAKTVDEINKGEAGFLDRDIYPFCFNLSDGKIVAVASNNAKQFLGTDIRALKDAARCTARNSTTGRRSSKSMRSATCFQSRIPRNANYEGE